MKLRVLLLCLIVLITACSEAKKITPAERQYILAPAEIEHFPINSYRYKMTPEQVPYILFKNYTEQVGFRGLFGTILISPQGENVRYLCLVNILPTMGQAHDLFSRMIPEPSPRDFGREETIEPGLYQADDAYLYTNDLSYFHLIIRSSRVVYTILLDGARIEEPQVRNGLKQKIAYIQHHLNAIR
jgi:hypothetical protein